MLFYRWAGDEFVLLLKDVDKEADLINYLDNLARLINKTMTIGENEIYISASVGACLYPRDGKSLEDLIKILTLPSTLCKNQEKHVQSI